MITKFFARLEKQPTLTLAGILVICSAIALGNMTRWRFWFDEAFSMYIVRFGFWDIAKLTAADVHPPLYYWLLKAWTSVFGTTELAARSMSLFFALVGIVGLYMIIRRIVKQPRYALIAALVAAISPMLIRFSDEARMYTLVFAIVVWATYMLLRMSSSSNKKWWLAYGTLLAAGMFTHYFIALAWLAHWGWRFAEHKSGRIKVFFSTSWIKAHIVGLLLFCLWIPIAAKQFATVQNGFWIPPVSAYSPVDYLSNALIYREYGEATAWWAVAFFVALAAVIVGFLHYAKKWTGERSRDMSGRRLLLWLAIMPPIVLMIVSMPPLKSSFVDRYALYAQVILAVISALGILRLAQTKRVLASVLGAALVLMLSLGIYNVYYYGNFNKNSNVSIRTGDVVREIAKIGDAGQPIIAASPWTYYEIAPYDSREHRVYFMNEYTEYKYGSLEMLKTSETGKITSLGDFTARHRYVWYVAYNVDGNITPPVESWKEIRKFGMYDYITKKTIYYGVLYDTSTN